MGAPYTNAMFSCAIRNGQKHIVKYLLTVYDKTRLGTDGVVAALVKRPDVKMFQLVYDHSPEIVNYESGSRMDSFLADACLAGPKAAPLIHFLLDHGADPDVPRMFGGALRDAVEQNQSHKVLARLVPHVSMLFWGLYAAIKQERLDAIRLIVTHGYMRRKFGPDERQSLLEDACAWGSRKVSTMVAELVAQWEAQSAVLERASINASRNEKARTKSTQDAIESDSDSTEIRSYKAVLSAKCKTKRWWRCWK